MQALRELNKVRGDLSKQLAALKSRYDFRQSIVDTLYDYYDTVADDYFGVQDGLLTSAEAVAVIRDYMEEHLEVLDNQLNAMREYLSKPVKPATVPQKLEEIKSHVYYVPRRS